MANSLLELLSMDAEAQYALSFMSGCVWMGPVPQCMLQAAMMISADCRSCLRGLLQSAEPPSETQSWCLIRPPWSLT